MTSRSIFQDQRVQDFTPRVTLSMCSARRVSPDHPIVEHVAFTEGGLHQKSPAFFQPCVLCYQWLNHPLCKIRILKGILHSDVFWTRATETQLLPKYPLLHTLFLLLHI